MGNAWSRALTDYETAMRAAGRSAGTIRLHRHYLSLLWTRHRSPWRITTGQLREVLAEHAWSPETRKSARTVFRSFYRWAAGVDHVIDDPALLLETVRVPAGRPRPTPEHLVRQLLRHRDRRIGLMAMLAAYGGLRCAEIAQVHAEDLVGDELVVHGSLGRRRSGRRGDEQPDEAGQGAHGDVLQDVGDGVLEDGEGDDAGDAEDQ